MYLPGDFELSEDADGTKHAIGPFQVTVLPHGGRTCNRCHLPKSKPQDRHRIYYQRELDADPSPPRSALVAQLNDVRVYVSGTHIVVTNKRLKL